MIGPSDVSIQGWPDNKSYKSSIYISFHSFTAFLKQYFLLLCYSRTMVGPDNQLPTVGHLRRIGISPPSTTPNQDRSASAWIWFGVRCCRIDPPDTTANSARVATNCRLLRWPETGKAHFYYIRLFFVVNKFSHEVPWQPYTFWTDCLLVLLVVLVFNVTDNYFTLKIDSISCLEIQQKFDGHLSTYERLPM